jgi:hypothetical protein
MKDSIYIAISFLVIIIVAELVGMTYFSIGKDGETKNTSVLGQSVNTSLVSKLCENYSFDTNQLAQTKETSRSVQQCGKFYRVDPPKEKIASPYKMVNGRGEVVALCGGADLNSDITSFEQPECETVCGLENLCKQ